MLLKTLKTLYTFCTFYIFNILITGCANQLPPGGGEEDKVPPKIVSFEPGPGTTNFKGDKVVISFDEYVDRRSFQDAFRISPPVSGEITFDWSGKEVEVIFPKTLWKLYPDKTFLVSLNSSLKDLHGNSLTEPLTFAFSTGPKIDKAEISGKVFNNVRRIITILAYNITDGESGYDPTSKLADYITETSAEGNYILHNLAPAKYRIIAIDDDDKNLFYTAGRESFAVLPEDITITDSLILKDINFNLFRVNQAPSESFNPENFFKDTLDIVYSSIENSSHNVLPEQAIQFYFKNYIPERSNLESTFHLRDAQNNSLKTVFNWRNDSLLEVFPALNFMPGADYTINFVLPLKEGKTYSYKINFKTASSNSFGDITGSIKNNEGSTIIINLESKEVRPPSIYTYQTQDTIFRLKKILENEYILFAYIDKNGNAAYDFGNPFPFEYSEKFFYYPTTIKVKGGWTIENVVLSF